MSKSPMFVRTVDAAIAPGCGWWTIGGVLLSGVSAAAAGATLGTSLVAGLLGGVVVKYLCEET